MDFRKKEAIIKNLKNMNISFETFSQNYYYCGGDHERRQKYFYEIFKHYNFPKKVYTCLCNTNIKNNCYVYNKKTKDIIILGSCCIKKFCVNGTKKTCELCNSPHSNRKINRCDFCLYIKIYSGKCVDCEIEINTKFKRCYSCFNNFKN